MLTKEEVYREALEKIIGLSDLEMRDGDGARDIAERALAGEPSAPDFRVLLQEAEDYVREDQRELRQRIANALHSPVEPTAAPYAWTIPGDDNADVNGFIPARIDSEGEFTKPLYARPARDPSDESVAYSIEDAIRIAGLWRAGKMIGGDEDGIRNALLAEVERLRALNRGAGQ